MSSLGLTNRCHRVIVSTFILGPGILIQELLVCEPQKDHVCYVEHAKALCFDSWDITSSVLSSYSLDSYSKTTVFLLCKPASSDLRN